MNAAARTERQDYRHLRLRAEAELINRGRLLDEAGRHHPTDPLEQAALDLWRARRAPAPVQLVLARRDPTWSVVPQPNGAVELHRDGRHLRWLASHVATPDHVAREILLSALGAEAAEQLAWDFGQEHAVTLTERGGTFTIHELTAWAQRHNR